MRPTPQLSFKTRGGGSWGGGSSRGLGGGCSSRGSGGGPGRGSWGGLAGGLGGSHTRTGPSHPPVCGAGHGTVSLSSPGVGRLSTSGGRCSPLARPTPPKGGGGGGETLDSPRNPAETDPRAPEVTQTQQWQWDFWNPRVEGVQKSHHLPRILVGKTYLTTFNAPKLFQHQSSSVINGPVN